jgi:hypothetical protein
MTNAAIQVKYYAIKKQHNKIIATGKNVTQKMKEPN